MDFRLDDVVSITYRGKPYVGTVSHEWATLCEDSESIDMLSVSFLSADTNEPLWILEDFESASVTLLEQYRMDFDLSIGDTVVLSENLPFFDGNNFSDDMIKELLEGCSFEIIYSTSDICQPDENPLFQVLIGNCPIIIYPHMIDQYKTKRINMKKLVYEPPQLPNL